MASLTLTAQKQASPDEVKKEANRLFEDEEYARAYKLYSQLVSNYPKDPEYNFRLGVCMIYAEPDKKKCLQYLKTAAANPEEAPKDVHFYLGKAYHINYRFDDALRHYNEFKKTASASRQKKLQVDREIQACNNGKFLLSNMSDLEVKAKKELNETDYFRSYDLKDIGGKLLVKPQEFYTGADRKKKDRSVVFLPKGGDVVFYSSYGEKGETGKDIYSAYRQVDGSFGKPEKVPVINTEYDEDYPFLHPNGKTLYFASKGHNSMGGYDIFRSVYNEDTRSWSQPENLEFPINSPDDDFLFVTDSLEKNACFSTGRQSPPGKIDVLKISTQRKPIDVLVIRGEVQAGSEGQSLESVITAKLADGEKAVGKFSADAGGEYSLLVPNGAEVLLTVETPGLKTQTEKVKFPLAATAKPYRQTITYDNGKLKIINSFDEPVKEDNYLQYLAVIEEKAKLDVNEGKNKLGPVLVSQEEESRVAGAKTRKENRPQVVEEEKPGEKPLKEEKPGTVDNASLARLALDDAGELKQESAQLKRDAQAAAETGRTQKTDAETRLAEAEGELKASQDLPEGEERSQAITAAEKKIESAKGDIVIAENILKLSEKLEQDAAEREKEAALNEEYAAELGKAKNGDPASVARLEGLQKQINAAGGRKHEPAGQVTAIQEEIAQKEKQIETALTANTENTAKLAELKTAIATKEEELEKTRKKSKKQEISDEIARMKSDQDGLSQEITDNETMVAALKEDIATLRNDLGRTAAKRVTPAEKPVAATNLPAPTATVAAGRKEPPASSVISAADLKKKYEPALTAEVTSGSEADKNIALLKDYNSELDASIAAAEASLSAPAPPAEKQKLSKEIADLRAARKASDTRIAALEGKRAEPGPSTFEPINVTDSKEAARQLDRLSEALSAEQPVTAAPVNDPRAKTLSDEASEKIKEANEKQKALKQLVDNSRAQLKNPGGEPSAADQAAEGEELFAKAQNARREASAKTGAERETLLKTAADFEEQGNTKLLDASVATGKENALQFETNRENVDGLLAEAKSPQNELEEARRLNDEANQAYRQAADIRKETESLTTIGAMLGSMSNAEEKEAEAILKQQQAVEVLRRSNPSYAIKSVPPRASTQVAPDLAEVNRQLAELAAIKIAALVKTYESGEAELDMLKQNADASSERINGTPALKTAYVVANAGRDKAIARKQTADAASGDDARLNELQLAIAQQNEAIAKFNELNQKLAAEQPAVAVNEPPAAEPPAAETETTAPSPVPPAPAVDLSAYTTTDHSTESIVSYFGSRSGAVSDPAAAAQIKSSLEKLKALGQEPNASASTDDLKSQAAALQEEAERQGAEATSARREAEGKEGAERDAGFARAKELETSSQEKMLEAAKLTRQANQQVSGRNELMIGDLTQKLSAEGGGLSPEQEEKKAAISQLATQARNLRDEAAGLTNNAAKLGAMMNAEEKEAELLGKQKELVDELTAAVPGYQPPEAAAGVASEADVQSRLNEELKVLTGVFQSEFDRLNNKVPAQLSDRDLKTKQSAEALNNESGRLLSEAAAESDGEEKTKKLNVAARVAGAAVEQLSALVPKAAVPAPESDVAKLGDIGSRINESNNPAVTKPVAETRPAPTLNSARGNRSAVRIEGLEVIPGNAYSAAKPIPFDAPMPDGLTFRVQIGAFRTRLPDNAFRGLSPLNGETTASGYLRYTAGNFNKIETANAVKNDLRGLGYNDAFVVAYYNGKRISLAEAIDLLAKEGKTLDAAAPLTAGITENANIPKAANNPAIQEPVEVTKELDKINGLLYTIQIGVFNRQVSKQRLLNLRPIYAEQLENGLFRYTAGIYNNAEKLASDRRRVVEMGLRDAFISAYIDGKRVPIGEARSRQQNDASIRLEPENPIVFPSAGVLPGQPAAGAQPFSNNVRSYPPATPGNGIKTTEEGVCFKVQIGAYSRQVPPEVAARFSAIRDWPVENKQINGLFIYNVGNFSAARFAKALRDEAIRVGITDAFITVYRDGKKLYGAEASQLLSSL